MDKNGGTIFSESSSMDFEKLSENRISLSGIKMDRKISVETTAFVILHYGSRDVTDQCVQSVLRMDHQESVQIIIVDNEIQKPEADRAKLKAAYQGIPNITVLMIRENGGFSYFLQTGECAKENRSKIKVSKWIDTPDLTRNQQFTLQWHNLLHAMEERLTGEDEGKQQEENLLLLRLFYLLPYEGTTDFYSQFTERMEYWNEQIR